MRQVTEEQTLAPSTPTQTLPGRLSAWRDDDSAARSTAEQAAAEEWGDADATSEGASPPMLVTSSFPQVRRHHCVTDCVLAAVLTLSCIIACRPLFPPRTSGERMAA